MDSVLERRITQTKIEARRELQAKVNHQRSYFRPGPDGQMMRDEYILHVGYVEHLLQVAFGDQTSFPEGRFAFYDSLVLLRDQSISEIVDLEELGQPDPSHRFFCHSEDNTPSAAVQDPPCGIRDAECRSHFTDPSVPT